jgi:hypothetical protein
MRQTSQSTHNMANNNKPVALFPAPNTPFPTTAPLPTSSPMSGNVTATSISSGSPFGRTPSLTPEQSKQIMGMLGGLTYSVPAGGYLFSNEAQNANSYYNKFGAGGGGNPAANRLATEAYGIMGNAPTVPGMTAALQSLYTNSGLTPRQGPSYNAILANAGQGPYQGPWGSFGQRLPGYNPSGQYHPDNREQYPSRGTWTGF